MARSNTLDRFLTAFRPWADHHVAGTAASPGSPLPPFSAAYFDDPVFAADLTATLAARVHQSVTGTPGPGDPSPDTDPPLTLPAPWQPASNAGYKLLVQLRMRPFRLPGDRAPDLAETVRISIRLSRAGMPRQQRVITWDQPSANYVIEYPVPHGGAYRLIIRPRGSRSTSAAPKAQTSCRTGCAATRTPLTTRPAPTPRPPGTPPPPAQPTAPARPHRPPTRASNPPRKPAARTTPRHSRPRGALPGRPQDRNKRLRRQHPAPGPGS